MQHSTNFNFNLPLSTDFADISKLTENWNAVDGILENITEEEFEQAYALVKKTTVIEKSISGKTITETNTETGATAVTTFAVVSGNKVITTVVTPPGDYIYTKTATIVKSGNTKTITETYTKTPKS